MLSPNSLVCYASPQKAELELGWKAEKSIKQACEDSWRWQSQNPNGYSYSTMRT